jgi:iron(III) transport system substrate-binding protein
MGRSEKTKIEAGRRVARLLLPALLIALCVCGGAAQAEPVRLQDAARKDGALTWYVASIDAANAEAAGRAFTAAYGVKVNVVRAPSPVMFQRLTQDLAQNARSADVFSSVDIGNFVTLKAQGALLPYKPENAAGLLPPFRGMDKDAAFHATIASVIVLAYNKAKVKAADAPRNWTDLIDSKWAGKIALAHPAFSGFAGSWAMQMNKMYGKPFFQGLEKVRPQVGRSLADVVDLVASGERLVTAAPMATIMANADKGKPLGVHYPADGAILVATPSAILKTAPHPNAAKLFMEFLLGPTFGDILVHARYEAMRADVKPLPGAKPVTDIKIIRPTIEEATKGIPKAAELWRKIFDQ